MRYVTNKGEYILTLNYLSAAALFALSSIGYAGSMGPACVNNKANLLCEKAGWDLGLHALYLQSSYGDDLRFIGLNRTGVISTDTANSSRWSWGFQLEGAYHFKNGGDVNLNWSHLDGKRTGFSPSLVYFNGGASGVNTVSVQSKWDALNLEMGKSFGWANSNTIRLHGGVQFASIQTEISEI
ncbi:MAG: Lpg1974 family pore-forming outer membrane protein, partial [bacterium]|nr:Lpg1974 family pore-forming outer membrane protein [bacterium]